MLTISDNILNKIKNHIVTIYTNVPLVNGCECFESSDKISTNKCYVSDVNITNIRYDNGKYYYTEEFNNVSDWWPANMLPIICAFSSKKKHKLAKSCVVDVSNLPAFNCSQFTNEDISVHIYRLYVTLFKDYSIKQCVYDRRNFFDAEFKSSKFDLPFKIQNSDFLQSKDFTIINVRRKEEENVPVGWIVREDDKYITEYGKVYINMDNQISIKWH